MVVIFQKTISTLTAQNKKTKMKVFTKPHVHEKNVKRVYFLKKSMVYLN